MTGKGNWIALAWLGISLFTFAWSASDPTHKECSRSERICTPLFDAATSGVVAGVLWPLYWAWTGAEVLRKASNHD